MKFCWSRTRDLVAVFSVVAVVNMTAFGQVSIDGLLKRTNQSVGDTERQVLAFYYPWYGTPSEPAGKGQNLHWGAISPADKSIEMSTHYPALGAYDSHNPRLVNQHCTWAREAGVDGFIVSWWGHGDYTDTAMPVILREAVQEGLSISAYYESVPAPHTAASAAEDIKRLLRKYSGHPAWLKVNNRPVLFIYGRAVNELGLDGWLDVQTRLQTEISPRPLLIGDQLDAMAALTFDGIHTYNPAAQLGDRSPEKVAEWAGKTYPKWIQLAEEANRISTVTIIPGYDDTKIRTPGLKVDRHNGATYRQQWKQLTQAPPDWVLITSFNEWHEGSEIEPSHEYGKRYLEMTAKFANRFKAATPRSLAHKGEPGLSAAEIGGLRKRWEKRSIALLPGAESSAVAWMLNRLRLRPSALSWQQLVTEQPSVADFQLLVYAGGEHYQTKVNESGDVDEALRHYLRSGGCLAVLPSMPTPFYYNRDGQTVANASQFGLFLSVGEGPVSGWEQPPANKQLRFVQPARRLPHLPKAFAFPKSGDLRWRPFVPETLASKDVHIPLLELRDESGNYLGDAATYVALNETEPKGGRLLYSWFTLLKEPQRDALLYDIFDFLAKRLENGDK